MIQLVDLGENYHEFKTVDEALGFLWGKDVAHYRVLVPMPIPDGYEAAKELLENANVSGGLRPEVKHQEIKAPVPEPQEEPATSIAGNMPAIGIGFEAGPKR